MQPQSNIILPKADPVIDVRGLGKRYHRDHVKLPSAHETIEGAIRRASGWSKPAPPDEFWAVKDCSFQVNRGETVGIMGRNGAGKSVLLKMLARVIKPTAGEALLRGRVTALLELGSGFHPDMTGRENIFFSGAIRGYGRAEMNRRLPEIVDFSGVGSFLDTAVKRYSSGMFMRLAFSVAIHLDMEILILDEVLAVGDAGFRDRCLEKVREVSRNGCTILMVSHEKGVVSDFCTRALYIDHGQLIMDGAVEDVLELYRTGTLSDPLASRSSVA